MILHLALCHFKPDTDPAAIARAGDALVALRNRIPEIRDIVWTRNLGPSAPDYPYVVVVTLEDMAAVQRYLEHPAHVDTVSRYLAPIRDGRMAVDIEVP
jgi:hypothetical protein